jgi:signal peptidase I
VQTSPETRIVPSPPKGGRGRPQQSQQSHLWREILETVLLTALVYFVVRSSVQFTPVDGPSMQPGLYTGQSVIVNELAYLFGNPQRGDVIVFHPPPPFSPKEQFIKRIIAVPGDTISVTDSAVIVDGVTLHEPYVNAQGSVVSLLPDTKIAPGDYFVMGDNRNNSEDSRVFGPVHRQTIVGKADLVIWPLNVVHWIPTYREVFAGVHP